jgi:hypothetical protein
MQPCRDSKVQEHTRREISYRAWQRSMHAPDHKVALGIRGSQAHAGLAVIGLAPL